MTGQPPGTVVVDTKENLLYYVLPNKKAIRYGVSTGKEAYGWTGTATVKRMAEWPSWMPPADMLKRWPHLKPVVDMGGLKGGPENPLGARALYLYDENGKDTLYRIHGTNEPETIGRGASSGCIRMRNIDVIDLYNRVKVGTKVDRPVEAGAPGPLHRPGRRCEIHARSSGGTPSRTGSPDSPRPPDTIRWRPSSTMWP